MSFSQKISFADDCKRSFLLFVISCSPMSFLFFLFFNIPYSYSLWNRTFCIHVGCFCSWPPKLLFRRFHICKKKNQKKKHDVNLNVFLLIISLFVFCMMSHDSFILSELWWNQTWASFLPEGTWPYWPRVGECQHSWLRCCWMCRTEKNGPHSQSSTQTELLC